MACGEHAGCYVAGCQRCRANANRYRRATAAAKRDGTYKPRRPLAEVLPHLREVRKTRTLRDIAAELGIAKSHLTRVQSGAQQYVLGWLAEAIEALHPAERPAAPHGFVWAAGTVRRVHALSVIGYSGTKTAARFAIPRGTINGYRRATVDQRCADQIAAAYATVVDEWYRACAAAGRRLDMHPDGDPRTRTWALRRGWHGPDVWDDDTIDDPAAEPSTGGTTSARDVSSAAVFAAISGRGTPHDELTLAERIEVVTILTARGWPDEMIGEHLQWGDTADRCRAAVTRFRGYHGIPPALESARAVFTAVHRDVAQRVLDRATAA